MTDIERFKEDCARAFQVVEYALLSNKLTTAYALQISKAKVVFETNETFALRDVTFAYYCPTDSSIHINIENPFILFKKTRPTELAARIAFTLLHEVSHQLFLHVPKRLGQRDPILWNVAADYETHSMLSLVAGLAQSCGSAKLNSYFKEIASMLKSWGEEDYEPNLEKGEIKGLFSEEFLSLTAEEIYDKLLKSKTVEQQSFKIGSGSRSSSQSSQGQDQSQDQSQDQGDTSSQEGTVTVTTYELPNGEKVKSYQIDWKSQRSGSSSQSSSGAGDSTDTSTLLNRQMLSNEIQDASKSGRGTISSKFEKLLSKLFSVKIDWEKILKNSLRTILAKSDVFTWRMPRMSTLPLGMYLPSIEDDTQRYGTVLVCLDESGSMSNELLEKAASVIAESKEFYKKVSLLKHDTDIISINEFEELDDSAIECILKREAAGGTSHRAVFEHIKREWTEHRDDDDALSCVILITDCCSDIETCQDQIPEGVPLVWLVPKDSMDYARNVKGKVIPLE